MGYNNIDLHSSGQLSHSWEKTYGYDGWDHFRGGLGTKDGGLILTGAIVTNKQDGLNLWMVKTNQNGVIDWS